MRNELLTRKLGQLSIVLRSFLGEHDEPGLPFALLIPHVRGIHALCLDIMQVYALTELHGGTEPLSEDEQGRISVLREHVEQGTLRADTMAHACVRRIDGILSRPAPSFDEVRGVLGAWDDYQALVPRT